MEEPPLEVLLLFDGFPSTVILLAPLASPSNSSEAYTSELLAPPTFIFTIFARKSSASILEAPAASIKSVSVTPDASILLGKEVKPNETTEISIEFTAPLNNGEYTSWWILSDADEANFGQTFYVKFVVGVAASPTNTQVPPATATATEAPSATP